MVMGPRVLRRQRAGGVEAAGGARRRDQLLDGDLQRERDLVQHRQRRVGGARLEVLPGRARQAGQLGQLLLRQAARGAQLADVGADAVAERIGWAAHGLAFCQQIGILRQSFGRHALGLRVWRETMSVERHRHRRQPRPRPRARRRAGAQRRQRRPGGARIGRAARRGRGDPRRRRRRARRRRRRRRQGGDPRHRRRRGGAGRADRSAGAQRQHARADAAAAAARHRVRGLRARAAGEPARPVPPVEGDRRRHGAARARHHRARLVGRGGRAPIRAGARTACRRRRSITSGAAGRRSSASSACA